MTPSAPTATSVKPYPSRLRRRPHGACTDQRTRVPHGVEIRDGQLDGKGQVEVLFGGRHDPSGHIVINDIIAYCDVVLKRTPPFRRSRIRTMPPTGTARFFPAGVAALKDADDLRVGVHHYVVPPLVLPRGRDVLIDDEEIVPTRNVHAVRNCNRRLFRSCGRSRRRKSGAGEANRQKTGEYFFHFNFQQCRQKAPSATLQLPSDLFVRRGGSGASAYLFRGAASQLQRRRTAFRRISARVPASGSGTPARPRGSRRR